MKMKVYSITILALILICSVASIFILNMNYPIASSNGNMVYYTSKVIAILLLVGVGALFLGKKYKGNMPFMMFGFATIYQFLPLGIRFLVFEGEMIVFAWILTFIVSIIFIALILVFEYISSRDNS